MDDSEEIIFKAPAYPENHEDYYFMNSFALQLNQISEELE